LTRPLLKRRGREKGSSLLLNKYIFRVRYFLVEDTSIDDLIDSSSTKKVEAAKKDQIFEKKWGAVAMYPPVARCIPAKINGF